ncbi:MAG: FAD-dependent oxidoreductase [Candidatus Altiarchaeales archaeon WOR_SM1_79]|nr:MAG: FAD-dependent oxidoreductase [Candidatus Altiarchaeales archaeon WOR_SM1_79]
MEKEHDVVIIGAGPAGMFAANELIGHDLDVLIVDQGKDIEEREGNIMSGVGGAGTFSDGTLNLRPDIGGDLSEIAGDHELAWKLVEDVDKMFLKFGASKKLYGVNKGKIMDLKRKAASVGIKFIEIPQRHIGTDNTPRVVGNFEKHLRDNGINFLLDTKVEDFIIKNNLCKGIKLKNGKNIKAKHTIVAPGRVGAYWMNGLSEKHKIKAEFGPIDVGVRVEVSSIIMDPIIKINRDPKFHIRTQRYDDFVRTFCTNYRGFVVKESYDDVVGVNGHSLRGKESENTNFAFLVRVSLTEPVENTIEYGKSIAKLATTIGGGKPILQRIGDLRRGRRSHRKRILQNQVQPTFRNYTPGDISMALPHRIVMDIIEGLEKLNEVIPGVTSDATLLYAPEIKFYATQLQVDENMETTIKNLFAAGDGAGLSRGIITAAATGILAGRGILRKEGLNS